MNRLVLVLAAVASSYVVACAAPTSDGTEATPPAAEESSYVEAKPHRAPSQAEGPVARAGYVIEAAEEPGAFVERRIDEKHAIPAPTPKPGFESEIDRENIEAPVPRDQDGIPLKRLTDDEVKRMVAAKEIVLPETNETKGTVYYSCNKWIHPGDVVFCGTNFFGWSPLFIQNCNTSGGVFFSGGVYYWVPPAYYRNGYKLCSHLDWSGWHWGKSYGFNNVGSVSLYVTH